MKTVIKCVFNGVYTLFKKTFLLSHTAFLRRFIYSRVGILDSPWCNIFCRAYQELGNGDFYSFGQEKVPFLVISLFPSFLNCNLPTHKKCNHQKNYTYLNLSITFVIKWTYTSLWNLRLPLLLFVIISSKLSTINGCFKIPTFFINKHQST